ncbi:MAG: insulinase family protein [Gemmatimonadaceae bacterium]|nr:insulinase family protein [Gemmatimonadaceae bacterium]
MNRNRFIVMLAAACLAGPAGAQSNPQPSSASAVAAPVPQGLADKTLANGLEIIVMEDHSVPLVTINFAAKNGSYTEPPELNGLSHLYEHMFFKSNRAIANAEEYLHRIGQLGIEYNGQTQEEVVQYYFTTISQNIRPAMLFMRDAIRTPLFDSAEFVQEQQVVIGEIDRNESNPYYYLNKEMNDRLFYKYPSRKNPLGNRQTVSAATPALMRLIQSRYYVPNNSALIVTGDVSAAQIYALAQELYGDWPARAKDPFVEFPIVEHPPLPKSEGAIIQQPVQNVGIEIGWQGPSIGKDNAATYSADVFSFILSQPNSRLQRNLVDKGLATAVGFGYYTQRNIGPITAILQTTPEKAHDALAAFYNEVSHFNDPDYFTDAQLENAKALLEADDLFSREKPDEYAKTLAFWYASTGLDYFRGYLGRLRSTSRPDISRYLTTYILGKPHIGLAIVAPNVQQKIKLTPEELTGK